MKWLPLAAFAALACADAGSGAGGRATAPIEPTTRDSAGVTIHEHPADALDRAPLITMDSVPLVVFAGDINDPTRDVSRTYGLAFTAAGDLVGFEVDEQQLVVLRVGNGEQQRYGRAGAGPGEIGNASSFIVLTGDSILFEDQPNNRLTIAHPDTGLVRTIPRAAVPGLINKTPVSRVGDSLFLLSSFGLYGEGPPVSGPVNPPRRLWLWRVADDSVHQLFNVPAGWMVQTVNQGPAPGLWSSSAYGMEFAPQTQVGQWGAGFLIARGERWELEQWDTAGRLRTITRILKPARAVDEALIKRYIDAELAWLQRRAPTANVDSVRAAMNDRPHADSVAAYRQVVVTPSGRIWVLDYRLPRDSGWAATVVAPDGRIVGRIFEPAGRDPTAFGDDRLAFRTEDEDGIATITVRKLNFPGKVP